MSRHTPGPWRVDVEEGDVNIRATEGREDDWYVATAHEVNDQTQTMINAHLIASAPDLLSALKALTAIREGAPGFNEAFRNATAAIAKAEGRS